MEQNALYIRTSTEEQGESISNQLQYLQEYCSKNDIKYDTYIDEHTGTNYNRANFIQLMEKCGLKYISEYNIFVQDKTLPIIYKDIYTKHSSRFSRDMSVLQIYELLLKNNIVVHFVEEHRDTTTLNNSTENFIFGIQSLINSNMSRENSVKVSTGMKASAKRGRILVPGTGMYGYDYDRLNNKLIPNIDEVAVIHKIFDLYLEGFGFKKICNYLNSNSIPTKKGGKWNSEGIRTLLTNRKLIGESVRNKMARSKITHDTKVSTRPQEDWIVVKYGDKLPDGTVFDSIPPIIDTNTFNAVQERIKSRVSPKNGRYRGTSILSSKIKCGKCGCNYVINSFMSKGIKHEYYTCYNKKLNTKAVCNNSNVQVNKLKEVCNGDWVNGIILRNKLIKANSIDLQISTLNKQMDKYSQQDVQSLTGAVIRLEGKKKTLIDYMLEGTISKNDYKLKMEELDLELDNTKTLIQDIQSNNTTTKYEIQRLKELKHKVLKTPINIQYSFEDICSMIKSITVNGHLLTIVIEINGVQYVDELGF